MEDQRQLFIERLQEGKFTFSDLCRQFDISRPCGYKWLDRYEKYGPEGLIDQSRAPKNQPIRLKAVLKMNY